MEPSGNGGKGAPARHEFLDQLLMCRSRNEPNGDPPGRFRGRTLGSGTDVWRFTDDMRAGVITTEDMAAAENSMSRSPGHCMTMGTASTMASMAEALGMALLGNAAFPVVDAHHDMITLDVAARRLELEVSEAELQSRKELWVAPEPVGQGGYEGLYIERVQQADTGVDLDFLIGCRGHDVPRESH